MNQPELAGYGTHLRKSRDKLVAQLQHLTKSFHQSEAENYELQSRLLKAESELEQLGFRRCDIAACNCGGYHNWNPV